MATVSRTVDPVVRTETLLAAIEHCVFCRTVPDPTTAPDHDTARSSARVMVLEPAA
jgi:hypothetical protein